MENILETVFERINRQPGIAALPIDASLSGIIITDFQQPDHPIIYCNRAFEILQAIQPRKYWGGTAVFFRVTTTINRLAVN